MPASLYRLVGREHPCAPAPSTVTATSGQFSSEEATVEDAAVDLEQQASEVQPVVEASESSSTVELASSAEVERSADVVDDPADTSVLLSGSDSITVEAAVPEEVVDSPAPVTVVEAEPTPVVETKTKTSKTKKASS